MTLEELYLSIPRNTDIDYFIFANTESLSAPIGDRFVIAIDPTKVRSEADEKVKVAHEAGHCKTGSFYSPGEDYFLRQRYENRADAWAIKKLVPKDELIHTIKRGITTVWELADHFGVTEPFMRKAMRFYGDFAAKLGRDCI